MFNIYVYNAYRYQNVLLESEKNVNKYLIQLKLCPKYYLLHNNNLFSKYYTIIKIGGR